jgi:hypothetical protein
MQGHFPMKYFFSGKSLNKGIGMALPLGRISKPSRIKYSPGFEMFFYGLKFD